LDDGLFALPGTPFQLDDPRFSSLRKCVATPGGTFRPSEDSIHRWSSRVLVSANHDARLQSSVVLREFSRASIHSFVSKAI
jgi:hypothetical protein